MRHTKDTFFKISAILILLSALIYMFAPTIAAWIMVFAVAGFTAITATNPYSGKSLRGKRLFYFQVLACILMVVASYLMFRQRNEWVLAMIAGAIFLLYAAVVIPKEQEKEKNEK